MTEKPEFYGARFNQCIFIMFFLFGSIGYRAYYNLSFEDWPGFVIGSMIGFSLYNGGMYIFSRMRGPA